MGLVHLILYEVLSQSTHCTTVICAHHPIGLQQMGITHRHSRHTGRPPGILPPPSTTGDHPQAARSNKIGVV